MSLLRFAARSMLASFFVVQGFKAFRDPESLTEAADPIAKKVIPLAESALPPQVAAYLPEDTKGVVRLSGIAQMVGGISLATGIGRRLGAGVLAATMVPHLVASNPLAAKPGQRDAAQAVLLRNIALTGGVLLAAADTEGQPNLAWRARAQRDAMEKGAERLQAQVTRDAARAAKQAKRLARSATKSIEGVLS